MGETEYGGTLYQLLIDGRWTDAVSGKVFASHNPATGEQRLAEEWNEARIL